RASRMADRVLDILYERKTEAQVAAAMTDALDIAAWTAIAAHLPVLQPVPYLNAKDPDAHIYLCAKTAQCFLPAMMHMCSVLEADADAKPMAIFPMRTSMIPAYITLDYSALVYLCYDLLPVHSPPRLK